MVTVRGMAHADAHELLDCDLKCFDDPWSHEEWREAAADSLAWIAELDGKIVGMIVVRRTLYGDVEIRKLCVKPAYRKQTIGRALLWQAILFAREVAAPRLFVVVRERAICPGQPGDLSGWLSRLGFRAGTPLLKAHFTFCGEPEDGIAFALSVPQSEGSAS